MLSKKIYILGYSGHAKVALDIALENKYELGGYFDFEETSQNPYHLSYLGNEREENLEKIIEKNFLFPTIGDNQIRKEVHENYIKHKFKEINLISLTANISPLAKLNTSNLIVGNTNINSGARIGSACIINTSAVIEHDCNIEDYVHIAPGAVLAGNVFIGKESFVGAAAVIKQGVAITHNVTVGAGAVVIKNIDEPYSIWVGNPAKRIK